MNAFHSAKWKKGGSHREGDREASKNPIVAEIKECANGRPSDEEDNR
jgi:hypothetical protein